MVVKRYHYKHNKTTKAQTNIKHFLTAINRDRNIASRETKKKQKQNFTTKIPSGYW